MKRHSTQIALFYQTAFVSSSEAIRKVIIENFPELESQIVVFPFPPEAPAEIPRVEVKSDKVNMVFSNIRADISVSEDELGENLENSFFSTVIKLGVTIARIGYISRKVFELEESVIKDNFGLNLQGRVDGLPFPSLLEAVWRVNKKTEIDGKTCNNLTTISLMPNKTSVLFERDVNNNPGESMLSFVNLSEISGFVSELKEEASGDLGLIK